MLKYDLCLENKDLFNEYINAYRYDISDINFTNLFIWRKLYDFKYEVINDFLCISGNYYNEPFVFFPLTKHNYDLGQLEKTIRELENKFLNKGYRFKIKFVPENLKNLLEKININKYRFVEDTDNNDYIYLSEDLINLKGRKYHTKKNHLNHFLRSYNFEYKSLNKDLIEDCYSLVKKLKGEFVSPNESMLIENEEIAIHEALNNFDKLDFKGAAILIDNKLEAFTLGEKLNEDTMVIHIEKGNYKYRGIYQAINQMFCESEAKGYKYINREEDMGFDYLRKAKESYYPVKLLTKYDVISI
ncbi:hypothetical protein Q428_05675 [Fervidicella metallireducens AeB]|uniref:Phosphatidylglycerol lysyltransferase C-terminal domain-containing protein n=1 Tax=Fervidicella metallireducens AeB TaxID=1403537 RepID=A0A017RWT0_9CLOT|nr:phosphatidylglycerol lysyltransferase domain-containing protein [Fervidicella metallireducens]EYE88864.1 hypothetical protein Q428_05675 [Fervidicella metallireducens AeB]